MQVRSTHIDVLQSISRWHGTVYPYSVIAAAMRVTVITTTVRVAVTRTAKPQNDGINNVCTMRMTKKSSGRTDNKTNCSNESHPVAVNVLSWMNNAQDSLVNKNAWI